MGETSSLCALDIIFIYSYRLQGIVDKFQRESELSHLQ